MGPPGLPVSRLPRFCGGSQPWGLATAHHWFRSQQAQLPSSPPPDFALSEPLPGGIQGWLRAVSDIRTCGPARRRKRAQASSSPDDEKKRGLGRAAMRRIEEKGQDRRVVQETRRRNRWKTQNCSFGQSESADGINDLQRGRTQNRALEGAVEALESGNNEQD